MVDVDSFNVRVGFYSAEEGFQGKYKDEGRQGAPLACAVRDGEGVRQVAIDMDFCCL